MQARGRPVEQIVPSRAPAMVGFYSGHPVHIGGSRVKSSEALLTKRDLPRRGGWNNRIPAIVAGHRSGPGATPDR